MIYKKNISLTFIMSDLVYNQDTHHKFSSINGQDHLYKSCQKNWIVVLQKLDDTITNEGRNDVSDPLYAKFRANKLRVVSICHKLNQEQCIDSITNSSYTGKTVTYTRGQVVEVDDFDNDLDHVCTTGIHYFKSVQAALMWEIPDNYTGVHRVWFNNGIKQADTEYLQGERH